MRVLLVVLLLSGCANRHVNRATLAVSTAMLLCDGMQTYGEAAGGWQTKHETNMLMGRAPDTETVAAYFATATIANIAAWVLVPEKYRSVIPIGVVAVQYDAIAHNSGKGLGMCGR